MPSITSELILRLKDELSPQAKKAAGSLDKVRLAEAELQKQATKLSASTKALADFKGLDKRLQGTTAKFDLQRKSLKDLGQQLLAAEGPTKKLEAAFKRAEATFNQTRESMERQKKAVSDMSKAFEQMSGNPLRSAATAEAQMRREIEQTTAAISRQAKESKVLIESQERAATRRKRISNAFSGVGMLAGPVILHGADESYKAGATLQHTRVELSKRGMGAMVPGLEQQALELAAQYKNVLQSAIMEMGADIRSVLTKPEEVAHVLPSLVAAKSVLDARNPGGEESQGLTQLVKAAEVLGAGKSPDRMVKLIDAYVKAMQVMGGTVNAEGIYDFAKNSRLAGAQFSDRFLTTTGPSLLQELGGQSAGKGANEAVNQLTGGLGKRTVAVKQLMNLWD